MVRIYMSELRAQQARRNEINSIPFDEIEFWDNNQPVEIPEILKQEWKHIGLNTTDFPEFLTQYKAELK
jgi:hypothetical protein